MIKGLKKTRNAEKKGKHGCHVVVCPARRVLPCESACSNSQLWEAASGPLSYFWCRSL